MIQTSVSYVLLNFQHYQVPDTLSHEGTYSVLVHGLKGVYFNIRAKLTYDSGYIPQRFAVHIQMDKAVYKPGQTSKVHFPEVTD